MKGFNESVPKLSTYLDASAIKELMMRADDNRFCTLYLTICSVYEFLGYPFSLLLLTYCLLVNTSSE